MTSIDHVMISTRGNWYQTNSLEHESDDRADNTVSPVCVTMVKIWHFSGKFDNICHCIHCGSLKLIQDRAGILVLVRVL